MKKPEEVSKRLIFVDILRIISMVLVFLTHYQAQMEADNLQSYFWWPARIFGVSLGGVAVSLFIFLSGFSLFISGNAKLSAVDFYKKRFARLMIPYWIYFAFIYLSETAARRTGGFDLEYFLFGFTGLETIISPFTTIKTFYFTDWYLGFIVVLYLLAPLLFWLYRKQKWVLLGVTPILGLIPLHLWDNTNILFFPLARIHEFLLGVLAADVLKQWVKNSSLRIPGLIAGLSLLLFVTTHVSYPSHPLVLVWLRSSLIALVLFLFFYPLETLFNRYFSTTVKNRIFFFAACTYPFFLCHHHLLFIYRRICAEGVFCMGTTILTPIVLFLFILISSILLYFASSWLSKIVMQKNVLENLGWLFDAKISEIVSKLQSNKRIPNWVSQSMTLVADYYSELWRYIQQNPRLLIATAVWGIAGYGLQLTNPILSIDEERGLVYTFHYGWIAQERFGIAAFDKLFLLNGKITPFISDAVAVVLLALATVMLCHLLAKVRTLVFSKNKKSIPIKASWPEIIFSGLFMTVPYVMGEFMSFSIYSVELAAAFGILATALYFAHQYALQRKTPSLLLSVVAAVTAFSFYQAFISVFALGVVAICLITFLQEQKMTWKKIALFILPYAMALILSVVIFVVIGKALYHAYGVSSTYLEGYVGWGKNPTTEVVQSVTRIISDGLGRRIYGGKIITVSLLVLGAFTAWKLLQQSNPQKKIIWLTLTAGLLFVPFMLPIALGSSGAPGRTLLALPVMLGVIWYILIISLKQRTVLWVASILAGLYLILFQIQFLNRMIYIEYLRYQRDLALGSEILNEIKVVSGGDVPVLPVQFVGRIPRGVETIEGGYPEFNISFFAIGESYRITSFFRGQGVALRHTTNEQVEKVPELSANMPTWPSQGSVQKFDDMIIVKLSEQ